MKSEKSRPFFSNLPGRKLNEESAGTLEADFTEGEIFSSLCSVASDKTLGLDGL